MPYKSKAQMRLFFAKEQRGELPKGKAREWAHHTPDLKSLPQHVSDAKEASLLPRKDIVSLMASLIEQDFSRPAAQAGKSAAIMAILGESPLEQGDPSIFAGQRGPSEGFFPPEASTAPARPQAKAAAAQAGGGAQPLNWTAVSYAQVCQKIKDAGTRWREESTRREGENDGFLLPSGVRVLTKAAVVAATGYGPMAAPTVLPVPGMPATAPMQGILNQAQVPQVQGLTPNTPQDLSGQAAINSTIQKKGPISASGDFANPNAGQDVSKFAGWKEAFGLSKRATSVGLDRLSPTLRPGGVLPPLGVQAPAALGAAQLRQARSPVTHNLGRLLGLSRDANVPTLVEPPGPGPVVQQAQSAVGAIRQLPQLLQSPAGPAPVPPKKPPLLGN